MIDTAADMQVVRDEQQTRSRQHGMGHCGCCVFVWVRERGMASAIAGLYRNASVNCGTRRAGGYSDRVCVSARTRRGARGASLLSRLRSARRTKRRRRSTEYSWDR